MILDIIVWLAVLAAILSVALEWYGVTMILLVLIVTTVVIESVWSIKRRKRD